jgi:hypothetical protein
MACVHSLERGVRACALPTHPPTPTGFLDALRRLHQTSDGSAQASIKIKASSFQATFCAYFSLVSKVDGLQYLRSLGVDGIDAGTFGDCPICAISPADERDGGVGGGGGTRAAAATAPLLPAAAEGGGGARAVGAAPRAEAAAAPPLPAAAEGDARAVGAAPRAEAAAAPPLPAAGDGGGGMHAAGNAAMAAAPLMPAAARGGSPLRHPPAVTYRQVTPAVQTWQQTHGYQRSAMLDGVVKTSHYHKCGRATRHIKPYMSTFFAAPEQEVTRLHDSKRLDLPGFFASYVSEQSVDDDECS